MLLTVVPFDSNINNINTMSSKLITNFDALKRFAEIAFVKGADERPILIDKERHVKKTAKSEARVINFKVPQIGVDAETFYSALATAKAETATEHTVVTENPDGTKSESKVTSNLLADELNDFLADVGEDAWEAFGSSGKMAEYFMSFITGVRTERDTEKSVQSKIKSLQEKLGSLMFLTADESNWNDEAAKAIGLASRDDVEVFKTNAVRQLIGLKARLAELQTAKQKRDDAKKAK